MSLTVQFHLKNAWQINVLVGDKVTITGTLTGDKDLEREGKVDRAGAAVKDKAEDAKDKVGDAVDAVKDTIDR